MADPILIILAWITSVITILGVVLVASEYLLCKVLGDCLK